METWKLGVKEMSERKKEKKRKERSFCQEIYRKRKSYVFGVGILIVDFYQVIMLLVSLNLFLRSKIIDHLYGISMPIS